MSLLFALAGTSTLLAPTEALAQGTVAWRYQMNGPYALHHGVTNAAGDTYVQDVLGMVYALSPSGQLLWSRDAGGLAEGPLAITADGVIIAGGNPAGPEVFIHAINPDGSPKWTFTDPGITQGIIAGPAVGPDGNVYAVTETIGLGVLSISGATGQLRWNDTGALPINERGQTGADISFGARTSGAAADQLAVAFDMSGSGSATGLMFVYSLGGSLRQTVAIGGDANVGQFQPVASPFGGSIYLSSLNSAQGYRLRSYNANSGSQSWSYPQDLGPPTNALSQPTVGPDGTIYVMRNLGEVHAVNPDGSIKWVYSSANVLDTPVVSPDNQTVVVGGRITYGQPGFIRGLNATTGALLWTINLPDESGVNMVPFSRPWFSRDSRRAYITTTLPGSSAPGYLYAINLDVACAIDLDNGSDTGTPDGAVDINDLLYFLGAFEGGNPAADLDNGTGAGVPDQAVTIDDLLFFLARFELGC